MENWLHLSVTGETEWPRSEKAVKYGDHTFVLKPRTSRTHASIHIEISTIGIRKGETLIRRFLSALSWKTGAPSVIGTGWSGNSKPREIALHTIPFGYSPTSHFPAEIFPIQDSKAQLAVSLYREGRSLNSIPYQFLSFTKILNIFWSDAKRQVKGGASVVPIIEGIRETLQFATEPTILKRIAELKQELMGTGHDPADYLYKSCRCAIAHAHSHPTVDPDNFEDTYRLSKDLSLMQWMCEHLISDRFGLKQSLFA